MARPRVTGVLTKREDRVNNLAHADMKRKLTKERLMELKRENPEEYARHREAINALIREGGRVESTKIALEGSGDFHKKLKKIRKMQKDVDEARTRLENHTRHIPDTTADITDFLPHYMCAAEQNHIKKTLDSAIMTRRTTVPRPKYLKEKRNVVKNSAPVQPTDTDAVAADDQLAPDGSSHAPTVPTGDEAGLEPPLKRVEATSPPAAQVVVTPQGVVTETVQREELPVIRRVSPEPVAYSPSPETVAMMRRMDANARARRGDDIVTDASLEPPLKRVTPTPTVIPSSHTVPLPLADLSAQEPALKKSRPSVRTVPIRATVPVVPTNRRPSPQPRLTIRRPEASMPRDSTPGPTEAPEEPAPERPKRQRRTAEGGSYKPRRKPTDEEKEVRKNGTREQVIQILGPPDADHDWVKYKNGWRYILIHKASDDEIAALRPGRRRYAPGEGQYNPKRQPAGARDIRFTANTREEVIAALGQPWEGYDYKQYKRSDGRKEWRHCRVQRAPAGKGARRVRKANFPDWSNVDRRNKDVVPPGNDYYKAVYSKDKWVLRAKGGVGRDGRPKQPRLKLSREERMGDTQPTHDPGPGRYWKKCGSRGWCRLRKPLSKEEKRSSEMPDREPPKGKRWEQRRVGGRGRRQEWRAVPDIQTDEDHARYEAKQKARKEKHKTKHPDRYKADITEDDLNRLYGAPKAGWGWDFDVERGHRKVRIKGTT